jgi:hypothetical protein
VALYQSAPVAAFRHKGKDKKIIMLIRNLRATVSPFPDVKIIIPYGVGFEKSYEISRKTRSQQGEPGFDPT